MKYSFIFPIHNEEDFLFFRLNKFIQFAKSRYKKFEIILVENGSSDKSWQIIEYFQEKFDFVKAYSLPYTSYGLSIKLGINSSIGEKIFILNVDYFDFDFIEKADNLLNSTDLVIGSKTLADSHDDRSFVRKVVTRLFNVFLRFFLNYRGTDTHGIKAFRRSITLINLVKICKTQNEFFDTELVIRLTRTNALFVDLPVKVSEIRKTRYSLIKRMKAIVDDLLYLLMAKLFVVSLIEADDFGLSKETNEAIFKAVQLKTVDIVSIMPNLVKKKDLQKLRKCTKFLKYSMHFNLLKGRPCAKPQFIKSLLNSDGCFYNLATFILRLNLGLINTEEIKTEFLAQHKHLKKLGVSAIYFNSEQHLHVFSPINRILEESAKEISIRKIRSVASSSNSLNNRLLRKFIFFLLRWFHNLRFGKFVEFNSKYDARITHPGA